MITESDPTAEQRRKKSKLALALGIVWLVLGGASLLIGWRFFGEHDTLRAAIRIGLGLTWLALGMVYVQRSRRT